MNKTDKNPYRGINNLVRKCRQYVIRTNRYMLECCNCYEQKSRQDKVTGNVGAGK